ncbi:outer membrane beta-barrel family protein [Aurantibacillus circumpalustris]|uniref:outer membrane beta-barrel family protein n=1 Tax=Aurantibacillus circumpalustris TaxID=3036359 RepID=UPI00295B8403|nr:outer membrane beta-barrel family protein [Aurantibacillus circumpalustris]
MKKLVLLLLALFSFFANAQMPAGGNKDMMKAMKDIKGRVYGKIIDANTKNPVEYSSVVVLWFNKDSILGGGLTKENGEFNIEGLPPMGGFRLRVTQIGYKTYETKFYIQMPNKIELDLGNIPFEVDEKLLKEVEITTDKNAVVMSIDKRTYNVDKDISIKGGTAVDVMKNVPGVTVDADGNAELRNQAPTLFVDGRPTNLTLQQIPADQIDRVEIITNPSVKYDASATGGILNIIMKKNVKPGYNGMAMAYIGTGDRYGGMVNLNVKEGKWNFTSMYSHNQAMNNTLGYTRRTQLDSLGNASGYFNQDNKVRQTNMFDFGKLGLDYSINNRNTITLSGMIVAGQFKTYDKQEYQVQDATKTERLFGGRINEQNAAFQHYNGQLLYKKTYPKIGQELTMDGSINHTNSNNGYLFTTNSTLNPDTFAIPDTYQKNVGKSNADQYVFQLDYTNPYSETSKLEFGLKAFYKKSTSENNTSRAVSTPENYFPDTILSNRYVIDDMVNAAYVNYNNKMFWDISYQAGLRFEQSYYKGNITDKNQSFSYNYPSSSEDLLKSIFPGIYFSKKLKKNQELQVNFSRKIQRPNFFQLMPFVMFADKQNYRIGNPQLKPEFKNIAELNYNKTFTKGSYLGSGYFRYEEQPITDVAYPSLEDPTVLVNTTVNGKNSIRYGMEHTFKYTVFKNFDATVNFNAFYIYIKGLVVATEPEVKAEGFAFNTKATLSYKLPKAITLQVNGNYESPKILLLGATIPVYSMDISLNKMFGTKWIVNATLSDVFNSRVMGAHYETPYYTQDLSRRRESRYVRLTVTYLFGKMDASIFKRAKQLRGTDTQQGNQDGLDFGK